MPLMLDAYSCAGHYADGLTDAGWEVVCVDNDHRALAHNPHHTVHGDALKLLRDKGFMRQFDAVHTSPPCQGESATRCLAIAQGRGPGRAVNLIPDTRAALQASGLPWVIENVYRSQLRAEPHTMLCGSFFGLKAERHRLFVTEGFTLTGAPCDHAAAFETDPRTGKPRPWGVYGSKSDAIPSGGRTVSSIEHGMEVLGITRRTPWRYLCEALPPAYGQWLGAQMLAQVEGRVWDGSWHMLGTGGTLAIG